MNKWILLGLLVLIIPFANARLFNMEVVTPDTGCSIYGCVFMGDIDMNGYIIYNATFANASFHEFDPVFTAQNASIWGAIDGKLNITDQRYNDSAAIQAVNASLSNYLLITDQRYNDTGYINNALNDYYTKTQSDGKYYNVSNPAGYINESFANNTYYPLNSNPAGYLTNATLNASLPDLWVNITGDTMKGNLNMSDYNITDVNYLYVHNISGRSPIHILSEVISNNSITADTFYGNINGQNGTIFGVTITNGSITNLRVSDSALFNTSLIPEINNTWSLGEPARIWRDFHVGNLYAANISSPALTNYYTKNESDNLFYSISNPKGYINQSQGDNLYYSITNPQGYVNSSQLQAYNDTALIQALNLSLQGQIDNKLNITDQRYNDTAWVEANYYNMTESDARYLGGGYKIWYFTNYTDNTSGIKLATATLNTSTPLWTTTVTCPGNTETNITEFITEPQNSAYVALPGTRQFYVVARASSIGQNTQLRAYVYLANSTGGNRTLLRTTALSQSLDLVDATYYMDAAGNYIEIPPTTRVIFVISAVRTGAGAVDVTLSYGDNTYSRQQFPSPVGVTDLTALQAADAAETQARIGNDSLKLNITDQRYNDTALINAVNTTSNIQSLGFNTTAQLNNLYYSITNPNGYVNASGVVQAVGNWSYDKQFYMNATADYANDSASFYSIANLAGFINWSQFGTIQLEPTGFDNPTGISTGTGATLSYNSTSKVFTISGTYSFWQKGINYTKTGDSVIVPVSATGIYFIYYNNGTLTSSNTITGRQFISDYVAVGEIYYNNNTGQTIWEGSELHGHIMDSATHLFIHSFTGTRYVSGLAPQNMTVDQPGNAAIDAQLGVSAGAIQDEDLQHLISAYPFPANIQVFYQLGTSPNWSVKTPDLYPMIYSGDSTGYVGANGRLPYNRLSGGVWTLTQTSANNNYVLLHLFANNDIRSNRSLFIVQGQNEYNSLANARTGATTELNSIITTGLPMAEAKPIATFIVKTAATMANVPKASFQSIDGTAQFVDWRFSQQTGSSGNIGGTVTLVNTGTGLTGGPITSAGTISLDTVYVQGMINAALANYTYNETDPRFTAENASIWNAINSKLNITDQRYNDTALINAVNTTSNIQSLGFNTTTQLNNLYYSITNPKGYINQSQGDNLYYSITNPAGYVNSSGLQAYNDTALIQAVNQSLQGQINNKLNITDQRYNDTSLINAVNTTSNIQSLGFNTTAQLNNLYYSITNPAGYVNSSGLQAYNDTALVQAVNQTIKQPSGPYLAYNNTNFWVNETPLNTTINNIAKVRSMNYTFTGLSGPGSALSTINITYEITQIIVIPGSNSTNYRFKLAESPSGDIIDEDRAVHSGVWNIRKSYSLNSVINASIITSTPGDTYTIIIKYLQNGVQ